MVSELEIIVLACAYRISGKAFGSRKNTSEMDMCKLPSDK